MNSINKYSGIDITSLRALLDLTQEESARAFGVTLPTVSHWKTGLSKPSRLAMPRLLKLADGSND